MELDCSKLMLGGSRRDGWGTIGGGARPPRPPPLGYAPDTEMVFMSLEDKTYRLLSYGICCFYFFGHVDALTYFHL